MYVANYSLYWYLIRYKYVLLALYISAKENYYCLFANVCMFILPVDVMLAAGLLVERTEFGV